MIKGLLPPFKIGERRFWIWRDEIFGASFMEWLALATVVLVPVYLTW